MITALKPGDVILWPRDKTQNLYTLLVDWAKNVARNLSNNNKLIESLAKLAVDSLANSLQHNYIHAEITMLNNYLFGAWFNGTHLWKPSADDMLRIISETHIYRPVVEIDEERLAKTAIKYRNKPYDFTALILNTIVEAGAFGDEEAEKRLEKIIGNMYKNDNAIICSELVARIYEDMGYKIERESKYVTPDDIAQSSLFKRIK